MFLISAVVVGGRLEGASEGQDHYVGPGWEHFKNMFHEKLEVAQLWKSPCSNCTCQRVKPLRRQVSARNAGEVLGTPREGTGEDTQPWEMGHLPLSLLSQLCLGSQAGLLTSRPRLPAFAQAVPALGLECPSSFLHPRNPAYPEGPAQGILPREAAHLLGAGSEPRSEFQSLQR